MTLGNSISLSRHSREIKWKRTLLSSQYNEYTFPTAERYDTLKWMNCSSYKTDQNLFDSFLRLGSKSDCVALLSQSMKLIYDA
jgi:hypothetical protein